MQCDYSPPANHHPLTKASDPQAVGLLCAVMRHMLLHQKGSGSSPLSGTA